MAKYDCLLIDGMNVLHRAAHSYDLGFWKDGVYTPVGSVYGFFSIVLSLHRKYAGKGSKVIICWDAGYKHRTDLYPGYKASRREAPKEDVDLTENQETWRSQRGMLSDLIKLAGWREARASGFEADDVMATLASTLPGKIGICTGDQDLHQCVSDRVHVISGGFGQDKIWTSLEVQEKWGFGSDRVAELKGLQGDAGDDIPGCPGCGLGWAQKLLTQYGTFQGVMEAAKKGLTLEGTFQGKPWKAKKLSESLRDNWDTVNVSYELAKVVRDCPVKTEQGVANASELSKSFLGMSFHSLLDPKNMTLIGEIGSSDQVKEAEVVEMDTLSLFGRLR